MADSPTTRTLRECRKRGWAAHVVEKWIPHTRRRVDAFGFGDVLAVDPSARETLLIQATTASNVASRCTKIVEQCSDSASAWLQARGNRIVVWGWRKNSRGRWELRERPIEIAGGVLLALEVR